MTGQHDASVNLLNDALCKRLITACMALLLFQVPLLALAEGNAIRMGSGDRIAVRVFGEADLSLQAQLGESGVINYPFLGEIKAAGLTTLELEGLITNRLKGDYLVEPVVHVSIEEYRPLFIDGEVGTPGAYGFQPGLTVGKAVALAKGLTERASKRKITIERLVGDEKRLIEASLSTEILPGDVITVGQRFF